MSGADTAQSAVDSALESFREFEHWCPGIVGSVLEFFVDIPEAKELRLYDLADEYGKLTHQLSDHLERISPSYTAIAENWSGSIGAEQFSQSMQQHMNDVSSSIKAAGSMQQMVQRNAQNIETMKFMAVLDLIMLAWTIYTLIMAAIATFGIAAVGAGPAIAATGAAIKSLGEKLLAQLAKEGVEAIPTLLKKAADTVVEQGLKKAAELGERGLVRSMAGRMAATRAAEEAGGKAARKALIKNLVDKGVAKNLAKSVARRQTAEAARVAEEAALKKFADAGAKDVAGVFANAALRRGGQFALFTLGSDGVLQGWQVATGHRTGFDVAELGLQTATGFLSGAVGTPLTFGRTGMAAEISAMVGGTLAVDAATHPLNNFLAEHSLFGMSPQDATSWGEWWSQEQSNLAKAASYGAMGGANHLRSDLEQHLSLVRDDPRPALALAIKGTDAEKTISNLVTFPEPAPSGLNVGEHGSVDLGTSGAVVSSGPESGAVASAPTTAHHGGGSTATADPGTGGRDVPTGVSHDSGHTTSGGDTPPTMLSADSGRPASGGPAAPGVDGKSGASGSANPPGDSTRATPTRATPDGGNVGSGPREASRTDGGHATSGQTDPGRTQPTDAHRPADPATGSVQNGRATPVDATNHVDGGPQGDTSAPPDGASHDTDAARSSPTGVSAGGGGHPDQTHTGPDPTGVSDRPTADQPPPASGPTNHVADPAGPADQRPPATVETPPLSVRTVPVDAKLPDAVRTPPAEPRAVEANGGGRGPYSSRTSLSPESARLRERITSDIDGADRAGSPSTGGPRQLVDDGARQVDAAGRVDGRSARDDGGRVGGSDDADVAGRQSGQPRVRSGEASDLDSARTARDLAGDGQRAEPAEDGDRSATDGDQRVLPTDSAGRDGAGVRVRGPSDADRSTAGDRPEEHAGLAGRRTAGLSLRRDGADDLRDAGAARDVADGRRSTELAGHADRGGAAHHADDANVSSSTSHDLAYSGISIRPDDDAGALRRAEEAYERFRADDRDIADIADQLPNAPRAGGRTGFSAEEIERVKQHVMVDKHLFGWDESGLVQRRFAASPDVVDAWIRLREGRFHDADIVLLEHELAEADYLRARPDATFFEAHTYADGRHNWDALDVPRRDEDLDVSWPRSTPVESSPHGVDVRGDHAPHVDEPHHAAEQRHGTPHFDPSTSDEVLEHREPLSMRDLIYPRTDAEVAAGVDALTHELSRVFAPDRDFGGLRVRMAELDKPFSVYRDSVVVRIEILHPERGQVGHARYELRHDSRGLYASVEAIRLEAADLRSHGFMREFHEHLERWYTESGPTWVELRATGLGRFVHALSGMGWDPGAGHRSAELVEYLRMERSAAVKDHGVLLRWREGDRSLNVQTVLDRHAMADPERLARSLQRQIVAADAVLEQARRHSFGTPGHPSPWAFVRAGWEPGLRLEEHTWIGQRAMEHMGEWRGAKHFDAPLDRPSVADVEGTRSDRFREFADRVWLNAQRDETPIRAAIEIAVERAGGVPAEDSGARIGALEHWDGFRDRLAAEIASEAGAERVDAVTPAIRYVADLAPERFEHTAAQIVDDLTARGYRPMLDEFRAVDAVRETRWLDGSSGRTFDLHLRADESRVTVEAGRIDHTRFVPDGRDLAVEGSVEAAKFGAAAGGIVPRDFADRSVTGVHWQDGENLVRVELATGRTEYFRPALGHGMDSVAKTHLGDGTEQRPHVVEVNDHVASDQFTRAWVHEITHALQEHTRTTPETIVRRGLRGLGLFRRSDVSAADDPQVAARVNERRFLERQYESTRSRDERAELRRDIEGLDRDLKDLGFRTSKLPQLAADEPAPRLRAGQPAEPTASKELPGGDRMHLRGDGRWHLEGDEPNSYRGDNGRLYLDRDPAHFYRDDADHRLHHDMDQPDTFRDERTFHLRDIASGDRIHDPLDDLAVDHRAAREAQIDHAITASPATLQERDRVAADRAAFARDVVQPLLDDLGLPDRLEDLHGDQLKDFVNRLRNDLAGDPQARARIDDVVRAVTEYHETRRDAVSAAGHDVTVDGARKILAERGITADAIAVGGWGDRLPIVAYDHGNGRIVVIEQRRVAGTRYVLADHTLAERGTPEYLHDLLGHDQRLYDLIAERPEIADAVRWAVERGELTVEYHRLGVARDGHVWTKSLGTHHLDVADLATRVPRDSGGLDARSRVRVAQSVTRVADSLDRIGNPGNRRIDVLDDATVTIKSGMHTRRIELTFTDSVAERYLVDRARLVVTDEGYRIELDHRAVDRLGADELDHMVTRALHQAEALLHHKPGTKAFKRLNDHPIRAGSLVRDPVVPKKLRGRDTFEVTHLRTMLDRLPGTTDVERQHLDDAVQRWIEEHGLREGMVGAEQRRQLIDSLLSRDAASRIDDLRTIEHAADPAVATVRKALHESTTWILGVGRSTADVSAVRLPDRDMFRLSPKEWRAEGRAGVTFQIKSGKPDGGGLVGFAVSRLRSHYVVTVDEAMGDMRPAERQYLLRRALSRAMEGIVAEQEKRPEDLLNRRYDAFLRNLPIVSSSGGWSTVEVARDFPFRASVKTHVTNLFDVATNNRFQVARRINAIEALQDLVLSAGLDEIGTHRDLQRAWLDVAWKDVEEMARLAGHADLARHLLIDLSDPPKSWRPLGAQKQAAFRERFRSQIVPALRQAVQAHAVEGVRDVTLERRRGSNLPWRGDTDAQVRFTWHKSRLSHVAVEVVEFTGRPDEVHVDYRTSAIVLQVPKGLTDDAVRQTLHDSLGVALTDIAKREGLLHARDITLTDHVRRAYPDVARSLFGAYPIEQVAAGAGESSAGAAIARAAVGAGVASLDSRMDIPLGEIQHQLDQSALDTMSRLQQQNFGRTVVDIATAGTRVTDALLEQATGQHQSLPFEARQLGDMAAARDATSRALAEVISGTDITVVKEPVDHPRLPATVDAYRLRVGPLNHVDVRFSYGDLPDGHDVQLVRVKKGEWLIAVRPDGDPATIHAESARIVDAITFARSHGVLSLRRQIAEGATGTTTGGLSAATIVAATHNPYQFTAALIGAGFRGVRQMFEYRHEIALVDARLATLEGRHEQLDVTPEAGRDALDTLRGRVESFEQVTNDASEALGRLAPDLATQVEHVDGGYGPVPAKWEPLVSDVGRLIQEPEGLPPGVRLTAVPDRPHTYQVEFSNNTWRVEFATFEARPGFAGDAGYRHFIVDSDVSNVVVIDPRLAQDDIVRSLRAWLKGEFDGNRGMASGYTTWRMRTLEGARDTAGQVAASGAAVGVAVITHDPVLTAVVAQGGFAGSAAMNAATNVLVGARHEGHMRALGDRVMQHARERGDNASAPQLGQFTGEVTALNNRMWQAYDRMQQYARIAATVPEADRPPDLQRWIDARSGGGGPAPGGGGGRPPDPHPRPGGPGPAPHGPASGAAGTHSTGATGSGAHPPHSAGSTGSGPGPSSTPSAVVTHPIGADWTRIDEQSGGVVAASTADATGAAAAEMLSHGSVSQDRILRIAGENASPDAIVTALNAEATGPWRVGPVGPTTFDGLVARGQWIAPLRAAEGGTHYVVVDGMTDTGLVHVRDPYDGGSSYNVAPGEFKQAWTGESMYRYDPPTSPGDEWSRGISLSRAAEMLSSGTVEHAAVIDHAGVDADPATVASALTDLTGERWIGGGSAEISLDLLTRHGPWAAEVVGDTGEHRYVLVDGRTDDGHLLIRDENGAEHQVDRADFEREWTGQALLPEDPPAHATSGQTATAAPNGGPDGSGTVERHGLPFGLTWKRVGVGVGLAALGALWYYDETQTAVPPVPSPTGPPPSGGTPPTGGFPPPVSIPPPGGTPPTGGTPPPHGTPPGGGRPGGGSPPSGGGRSHQPPSRHHEPGPAPAPGAPVSCRCGATWPRIHPHAGGAVAELDPGSSAAAAAQMLTHGRVTQAWVRHDVGDGARAAQIARALDEIWPHAWRGGLVDKNALSILDEHGSWAAEFRGEHDCIHYVVVDGVTPDGLLRIRDPFGQGSTYLMTRAEFLRTWDGVALFRDDPRVHISVNTADDDQTPSAGHGRSGGRHAAEAR